ncbi:PSD1 and planctomycete cytochrome C domain-containing protein [Haloferula chungangensis]|uniref:PSD1 and planctomycete cytochrome C domain-containing protein n=1 Tax=Haloferula chungangensis TaxID=1048331 RepID=A0ABW2L5I7_9BACT
MRQLLPILLLTLPATAEVDFAHDVRPILNANCTACHGGVKEAGEVSFIYREQALGKGESGKPVIVPGDPDASEMMVRILSTDEDEVMPKPEHGPPLKPDEIETLRQWIKEGAQWGEHWSFTPPKKHAVPKVTNTSWPRNDIDRFVLARIEAENLTPSKEADKASLLRRLSLDLTGLPPTLDELDAFIADTSPEAYEKQVDRLLASSSFGERWASMWLDLARYADSEGLGMDRRRDVWKYRDWLIDAFNRDQPYDEFTIDQLAGDLIPNSTLDQKIATTFHRLTQVNDEGGTDDEEFRVAAVLDRVSTTWEVWQGLTFGCVQCHSHPYDPIKHEEFYEFVAFFNQSVDADLSEDLPKLQVPLADTQYHRSNELQTTIRETEAALHKLRSEIDVNSRWAPMKNAQATATKAKLSIVEHQGREEYRSDSNVASGAVYQLTFPTDLPQLSALKIEFLPLDEETAKHTPEWGALLQKITIETIDADNKATPVALAEVIADEAHPLFNSNNSISGKGRGWGTYSKTFSPRHAIVVPNEPVATPPGTRIKVTIHNGGTILASFPMASKRGRLSITDDPAWTIQNSDPIIADLKKKLDAARKELNAIPRTTVPTMRERDPAYLRQTHVFIRGNWLEKGELIPEPDTPGVFPELKPEGKQATRLDLAKWIASPQNPLTALVAVNRFWLELFGTGIAPTPEDLGSAGEKPNHPQLLDTLALRFSTDMKWSMKTLIREIVTSATYRQDASISPELLERDRFNRFLARGPRQRLSAEMARDTPLAVSGLLTTKVGGPPVHPPISPGVWTPFAADKWDTPKEGEPNRYRRAIYTYWKRSIPYPSMITFDTPTREMCSKRRLVSNTPLQALTILNDPAFHECAQGLARCMKYETTGNLDARLAFGFRVATSREPSPDRLAELRSLFEDLEERYAAAPDTMKGLAGTPDGAAYTVVASVLLNLDEAITR